MAPSNVDNRVVRSGSGGGTGEQWVEDEHGNRYSVGPHRMNSLPAGETYTESSDFRFVTRVRKR